MPDFIVKIVLLGDGGVGKTSLVYRFIENRFSRDFKSTLGVNLLKKKIKLDDNTEISSQIWDLGGQEAYKKLRKLYLEGAQGALIVFDVLSQKSFDNLEDWTQSFIQIRGKNMPMLLIANKIDMNEHRVVSKATAETYAKKYNMKLIETSAATGENVEKAFHELVRKIISNIRASESSEETETEPSEESN
jgi:small GTP-binding protein